MPDDIVIYDGYGDGVVDGIAYDVPAALPGPVGSGSEWEHFDALQAAQVRRSGRAVEDGADYNRFEGVVGIVYGGRCCLSVPLG